MQAKLDKFPKGLASILNIKVPEQQYTYSDDQMLMKETPIQPIGMLNNKGLAELFANITPKEAQSEIPYNGIIEQQNKPTKDGFNYVDTWSKLYQTTGDPEKEAAFKQHVSELYGQAPKEAEIRKAIQQVMPAFEGEVASRGMTKDQMNELMYRTALHESMGGKYNRQLGDGPARSWWQVEPATAYDNVQNFGHAFGPVYEKATGYTRDQLSGMTQQQLGTLLENDPKFAASMSMLWYLRKMGQR